MRSMELKVAPRSWDDYRVGARGGRRVARHVWTPTASSCSSLGDGRRWVTGLVGLASDAGRPRAVATAGRRSDPDPWVRARSGAP